MTVTGGLFADEEVDAATDREAGGAVVYGRYRSAAPWQTQMCASTSQLSLLLD